MAFAPSQPYFLSPSLVFMSANAPHPYTGALFVDYLLSEEGQKIVVTTNRMPASNKVKSPESQILEGQDVRTPDIFDIGKRYQAIGNRYREIFRRNAIRAEFKRSNRSIACAEPVLSEAARYTPPASSPASRGRIEEEGVSNG